MDPRRPSTSTFIQRCLEFRVLDVQLVHLTLVETDACVGTQGLRVTSATQDPKSILQFSQLLSGLLLLAGGPVLHRACTVLHRSDGLPWRRLGGHGPPSCRRSASNLSWAHWWGEAPKKGSEIIAKSSVLNPGDKIRPPANTYRVWSGIFITWSQH